MGWTEGNRTHVASVDLEQYRRVKIKADGSLEYAGADDPGDGVTLYFCKAGNMAAIAPMTSARSVELEASEAIAAGADVYAADNGKVRKLPSGTGKYHKIGKALEAAAASGDAIEILPRQVGQITSVA